MSSGPPPSPSTPSPPRTPPSGVSYVAPKRPRPSATAAPPPETVSILTWNVWFGRLRQPERYSAIVDEVLRRDVDVACFQEVTTPFVEALTSSAEITERYDMSPNRIYNYGCLTIVRKSRTEGGSGDAEAAFFEEVDLPSRMGRTLVVARTPHFTVGNVHLESLDNEALRRDQLREANASLGMDENAILCGDFNFDSRQTYADWRKPTSAGRTKEELENAVLRREMPLWVDAWPAVKGEGPDDDPGITFDGATNSVCVRDRKERMRYDRIMVKTGTAKRGRGEEGKWDSLSSGLVIDDIVMVGTEPLDDTGLKPSDHYGLNIKLRLGRNKVQVEGDGE